MQRVQRVVPGWATWPSSGSGRGRGRHVVVAAPVLVEGDYEEGVLGIVPAWAVRQADGVIDLADEPFASQHAGRNRPAEQPNWRVHVVVLDEEPGLDEAVAGQGARARIRVELRPMAEVGGEVGVQPRVVDQPRQGGDVGAIEIAAPREAPRSEALEDSLGPVADHPVRVGRVQHQPRGRAGMKESAVAERLAGHFAVPVVAHGECTGEGAEHRHGLRGKAVHDALIFRIPGGPALGAVKVVDVVGHEPVHGRQRGHGVRGIIGGDRCEGRFVAARGGEHGAVELRVDVGILFPGIGIGVLHSVAFRHGHHLAVGLIGIGGDRVGEAFSGDPAVDASSAPTGPRAAVVPASRRNSRRDRAAIVNRPRAEGPARGPVPVNARYPPRSHACAREHLSPWRSTTQTPPWRRSPAAGFALGARIVHARPTALP